VGVTNAAASLAGYVYHDATTNHSGIYTNIDTGMSGVTVTLYADSNSIPGALVAATTTDANGAYQFLNLSTNKYLVVESLVPGYAASSSVNVATNVAALIAYTNINFFSYQPSATNYASISGSVTNDLNWNGVANGGEPGLANVTINLVQDLNANGLADAGEPVVLTANTGTNGSFSFSAIPPGHYVLQLAVPHGFYPTNVTLGAGSGGFLAATNASGVLTNFTQIGLVLTSAQNSSQNNFLVGEYQVSGTVFDDANGLTDGVVNGTATNGTGGLLYANLLSANSNVLASVTVATNGSYVFTNLASGTYLVQLSANAGTVGSAASAMVLPPGWVNTGGSTNGVIAGNTNGLLTVQLGTVLTNASFGIDQLPASLPATASYLNSDATSTVLVPALTGTDPEQGALGGTTNTVVIKTLPLIGTLNYNGAAVTANEVIANYHPALLTVNPGFQGAGTVAFTFAIEDAAGQASAAAAGVTINFSGVSLSGTVFNDTNGLTDGVVNGTATNATGAPLYINLIDGGGNVLGTVAVSTNGAYVFPSISSGNVTLQLSVNEGTVGLAAPVTALPAGWFYAGENLGAGPGSDGHPDGLLAVSLGSATSNANFGIWPAGGISGRALVDVNGNGVADAADTNGISGVTVVLQATNGVALATNVTDSAGGYVFTNVTPGNYVLVQAALPPGWFATGGDLFTVTINGGGAPVHDFLDAQPGSISGSVLDDVNRLGVFDASDTGVGGVTVVLQTAGGTPVATNVTTTGGAYGFNNVMPGSYVVVETDLPCWTSVADTSGPNDNRIPLDLATGGTSTGNNFLDEPSAALWNAGASLSVGVTNAAGPAGVGYGTQYYSCYLDIMATTNNPFTIDLSSYSGGNPGPAAGWNHTNTYTWTLATAADGVLGFAADKFVVDTSAFTNDLAGGTFTVTSDGYSVYLVYTPHPAPAALPMSIGRAWGTFLHISIPMLLSNYTAAAAGDATVFSQVGASTNGSYVVINTQRDTIDFAPTNNLPESFTYVITDTQVYRPGDTILTATNWITVNVTNAISLVRQITNSGSSVVITFAGVPGYKYVVERATILTGPWTTLDGSNGTLDSRIIAPATGVWTFTEIPPTSPVFYRSRQNN
jgi:hypothetical protein